MAETSWRDECASTLSIACLIRWRGAYYVQPGGHLLKVREFSRNVAEPVVAEAIVKILQSQTKLPCDLSSVRLCKVAVRMLSVSKRAVCAVYATLDIGSDADRNAVSAQIKNLNLVGHSLSQLVSKPKDNQAYAVALSIAKRMEQRNDLYPMDIFRPDACMKGLNGQEVKLLLDPGDSKICVEAGIGQLELRHLSEEFTHLALPSGVLSCTDIRVFFDDRPRSHGEDMDRLFRAMDRNRANALDFGDVILGLAVLQPGLPHGGDAGRLRTEYIFRYFSAGDVMTRDEYKSLVDEIVIGMEKRAKNAIDAAAAADKYKANAMLLFDAEQMNMTRLVKLAGGGSLRGTSQLLRLQQQIRVPVDGLASPARVPKQEISYADTSEKGVQCECEPDAPDSSGSAADTSLIEEEPMDCTQTARYTVARHALFLTAGDRVKHQLITDLEPESITASARVQMLNEPLNQSQLIHGPNMIQMSADTATGELAAHCSGVDAKMARDATVAATFLLDALAYFSRRHSIAESAGGKTLAAKEAFKWNLKDNKPKPDVAKAFLALCPAVRALLRSEPRCAQIQSPCFLMGDLHGNIMDLMKFEQKLWPLGPRFCPARQIFLGDYVDRGNSSFEVVAYLLSQKWLNPDKITLLRGNHEVRELQRSFSFPRECDQKFGQYFGHEVCAHANLCFDAMPLAAVIDDAVFCVHGGIPRPDILDNALLRAEMQTNDNNAVNSVKPIVKAVNSLDSEIACPQFGSLEWELLWNDPAFTVSPGVSSSFDLQQLDEHGFGPNPQRGPCARVFSKSALHSFLVRNGLSHVVRAHQVQSMGFKVEHDATVLTVFSSSNYCSQSNAAACVLADSGRLRVMQLHNEPPAAAASAAGHVTPGAKRLRSSSPARRPNS